MRNKLSRRDWLKTGALAGSAAALSSLAAAAAPPAVALEKVTDGPVRLTSNENPYGFSPKAKQVIADSVGLGNQYADRGRIAELTRMIADREGLEPENVVLGSGSGEVLCMTGAAYGGPAGEIVAPDLTFPLLFRYAENFGTKVFEVPLNERHEHDLEKMAGRVTDRTTLVYVCNPNNPTGTYLPAKTVRDFCETVSKKAPVFVDEAYLEYTEEFPRNSMVDLVRRGRDIIVSRTFSKIYGMAGMRIGYGLAPKKIAERLARMRMTWFNSLGVEAAVAAYRDTDFIRESRRRNGHVREYLYGEFKSLGMPFAESHGNFIWVRVGPSNRDLGEKMLPAGLLVRNAPAPHEEWARITIGTADQMKRFIDVLRRNP